MKDEAIVCNSGHVDNEIQVDALNAFPGVTKLNIEPQVDKYTFRDGRGSSFLAEGGRGSPKCPGVKWGFLPHQLLLVPRSRPNLDRGIHEMSSRDSKSPPIRLEGRDPTSFF